MNVRDQGYHELVGLFHNPDDLERAINRLASSGWNRADLSMLAPRGLLAREAVDGQATDIADDPDAERSAPVSDTDMRQGRTLAASMAGVAAAFLASGATIMTGGAALAAIVGAAAAGGGAATLVGAFGQRARSERDRFLHDQVEQGGILLWARLDDAGEEQKARDIFARCGATEIHLHGGAWPRDGARRALR